MSLKAENNEGFENHEIPANPDVEPVSSELQGKIAVSIRNLKKTFHRSRKEPVKAVDGIYELFYKVQKLFLSMFNPYI